MKSGYLVVLLCVLGVLVNALVFGSALVLTWHGVTDFVCYYAGTKLAGSPDLYNPQRVLEVEAQTSGHASPSRPYTHLPYYALLTWPLGKLSYLHAFYVWEGLSVAATFLFAWLWPIGDRRLVVLACCWSLPLFAALAQAQDLPFLLAVIAIAVWLLRKGNPFAAGLVFTLCAAKFHIFLLVPFWIVTHRLWRFGQGIALGGAVLVALCFAGGGIGWPSRYLAVISNSNTNHAVEVMPNLNGLFWDMPHAAALEILSALCVAALAVWSFRRMNVEYGLAMTIAAGLLIAHHGFVADCALLLPCILIVHTMGRSLPERSFVALLLMPLTYIGIVADPAMMMLVRAALIGFVLVLAWTAWRFPQPAFDTPRLQVLTG